MAGDGFMLNLLSVLQQLSVKIRVDKVDPYYPHHSRTRVSIAGEARLNSTSQEATDWAQGLGECDI